MTVENISWSISTKEVIRHCLVILVTYVGYLLWLWHFQGVFFSSLPTHNIAFYYHDRYAKYTYVFGPWRDSPLLRWNSTVNIYSIAVHKLVVAHIFIVPPRNSCDHCPTICLDCQISILFKIFVSIISMFQLLYLSWIFEHFHYEKMPIQIIRKFYCQKMKIFRQKKSDIFHISAQNIDCGHSLEPPRWGGSNEYPQSMFFSKNKKNNVYPLKPQFYYVKVGFKGVKII